MLNYQRAIGLLKRPQYIGFVSSQLINELGFGTLIIQFISEGFIILIRTEDLHEINESGPIT